MHFSMGDFYSVLRRNDQIKRMYHGVLVCRYSVETKWADASGGTEGIPIRIRQYGHLPIYLGSPVRTARMAHHYQSWPFNSPRSFMVFCQHSSGMRVSR